MHKESQYLTSPKMQWQWHEAEDDPGWNGPAGEGNDSCNRGGKRFMMALGVVGVRRLL